MNYGTEDTISSTFIDTEWLDHEIEMNERDINVWRNEWYFDDMEDITMKQQGIYTENKDTIYRVFCCEMVSGTELYDGRKKRTS